jgi:WD40 repeat protein
LPNELLFTPIVKLHALLDMMFVILAYTYSIDVLCLLCIFSSHVLVELLQVRFHPLYPEILASGSLDHEVRLWDANTAECIGSRDFCNNLYLFMHLENENNIMLKLYNLCGGYDSSFPFLHADRPIASIAFHAQGELLAVASGHKVRIFHL